MSGQETEKQLNPDLKDLVLKFKTLPVEKTVENSLQPCIDWVKEQLKGREYNMDFKIDRNQLKSDAHWIARQKKQFIKPSREKIAEIKSALGPAIKEINRAEEEMNNFKEQIRRPLTEWETEQKRLEEEDIQRKNNIKNKIEAIRKFSLADEQGEESDLTTQPSSNIQKLIDKLTSHICTESLYQEFEEEAHEAKTKRLGELRQILNIRLSQEEIEKKEKEIAEEQARIEEEKNRLKKVELERIALMEERFQEIKNCVYTKEEIENASDIKNRINMLQAISVSAEIFQNRFEEATNVKKEILDHLVKIWPIAQENDKKKAEMEAAARRKRLVEEQEKLRLEAEDRARRIKENEEKEKRRIAREREKDVEHRRTVNRSILMIFTDCGASEETAIKILRFLVKEGHPNIYLKY